MPDLDNIFLEDDLELAPTKSVNLYDEVPEERKEDLLSALSEEDRKAYDNPEAEDHSFIRNAVGFVDSLATQVALSPVGDAIGGVLSVCLLYTSPSPRDKRQSRMPSSA